MNFNISEYINGIFKGIVFFVYSYVQSCALIVWRPVRAAVQMIRRTRRANTDQINAYAFLFVSSVLLIVLLDVYVATLDISVQLLFPDQHFGIVTVAHDELLKIGRAMATSRLLTHYLIPALFQVVLVDLVARLLWVTALGRQRAGDRALGLFKEVVLYNFGAIFVFVLAALVSMVVFGTDYLLWVAPAALLLFAARHIVPVSRVFAKRTVRLTKRRAGLTSVIVSVALIAAGVGYLAIGISLTQRTTVDTSLYVPTVTKVECYLVAGPALNAVVVIANGTDEPRVIRSTDFELTMSLHTYNSTARVLATSFGSTNDVYVIAKGESAWFYVQGDDRQTIATLIERIPKWNGAGEDCVAATHSARFDGALATTYTGAIVQSDYGKIFDRRAEFAGSLIPR